MKKLFSGLVSTLFVASLIPFGGNAAKAEEPNVALWNAVKPLDTTVTFLNTGAHPDDERSDFLAYLSRGLGVKTSSLIANRGEGGQNEIGDELGNALGIIRSRELIEASKITGVKAYHLSQKTSDPIYDFGFSKSVEETLAHWGEDLTYERFIRFIRTYQPDIIMPSFRNDPSQHGHHRAVEVLTERSFEDAANPNVYPEQLKEGLNVWQAKKLYLPGASQSKDTPTTSIEIGMYDPIYQMTYPQLGEQSRFMHKSQGMGSIIPAGPRQVDLELFKSVVGKQTDLFAGVPYDFKEWAQQLPKTENDLKVHFTKLQTELESIISSYPNSDQVFTQSQDALKEVRNLENKTEHAKLQTALKNDLLHKLSVKEEQLQNASFVSSQLDVQASSEFNILTKGQTTTVTVALKNNGKEKLHNVNADLKVPDGWKVSTTAKPLNLAPGESTKVTYQVVVPDTWAYYDPYQAPVIQANVNYDFDGSKTSVVQDLKGTIAVLPDVGLTLSPEDIVVNTADVQKEIPVSVKVKNYRAGTAQTSVKLNVPAGWGVSPSNAEVDFTKHLEEKTVAFKLTPPSTVQAGNFKVTAQASVNGKTFDSTIQEIHYDHIGTFYYQYPAQVNGVAFELLKDSSLKIGYVDSGFDKVADYLSNVGMNVTKLTESDLQSGDLSQYNTIVVGIRAYLSRADLITSNERLKQYVYNGGHLVVQYHKPSDGWNSQTTAPYPLTIGNVSIKYRVTDENAKVTVLDPASPIFSYPNKITDSDWSGWVQERGLYYPMSWDSHYQTLVRMGDPGEAPFDSGILAADYGKGTYIYSSLVFYRQIQGQVPGGYRIFTNLISYGSQK
jgi:LmbE family N-acetylglucosaminyl deacetylase